MSGESKTFYTLPELEHNESRKYLNLEKEDWFLARSAGEGHVPRTLKRVTTRNLDPGKFLNQKNGEEETQEESLIDTLKERLMKRNGAKVQEVIKEIEEIEKTPLPKGNEYQDLENTKATKPRQTGRRLFVEE